MAGTRGGKREGAGRKSKSDEQKLIEKLSPLQNNAFKALERNIKSGEPWAVKLFFEYMYGKPKQQLDTNITGGDIQIHFHVDED
jgi:hypothetical protein